MKKTESNKTYLVTGAAGFIGFFLSKALLSAGNKVIGFDNLNDYYEVSLKNSRLKILEAYDNFTFVKGDITDRKLVFELFEKERYCSERVCK